MYDMIIVGCGAAGMMAGILLAKDNKKILILEQNEKPGKKLFITGKGRCNLTNNCDKETLFNNIVTNSKFMYSSFDKFDSYDTMDFFTDIGLKIKTERGGRVFPVSDHSSDVIAALTNQLKKLGVDIRYNCRVTDIITEEYSEDNSKYIKRIKGLSYVSNGATDDILCDRILVATGGVSYPRTGSTGDGLKWAQKLYIKVITPRPALVPLEVMEIDLCKSIMGLSLKNINASFYYMKKGKKKEIYSEFGEMIFTHFGISGPVVLSGSSYVGKYIEEGVIFSLDLKPALSNEQLDQRLLRDFKANNNKDFINALDGLLPKKLVPIVVTMADIDFHKKVNEVTKEERLRLLHTLKNFELHITNQRSFDEAIITQGGISVKEINPSTMESKKVKGLYFAGEVIDVDALTGGFNLQIAWSSANSVSI